MSTIDASLLARAALAADVIAELSSRIESGRRLPEEAVNAFVSAGVFKLLVPRVFGGSETNVATLLAVIESIARADGSAGWCAMIGATSGLMSVYLDQTIARDIYSSIDAITCGVFAPMGRAIPEGDGYRISGRWSFASGCQHSAHRMGGTIVAGAALLPSGAPDVRSVVFRADETRVIDTWDTSGLRGTGSHDIEVIDVLVPASRTFSLFTDAPKHSGYGVPFFGVLAASVGAVALGIARAAIDAAIALTQKKQPPGAKRSVAHRETVQLAIARAEAKVRGARAFLFDALARAEVEANERGAASLEARALLRLAASHAASESAAAVDIAYETGGASSIYSTNPLQRHFRDIHVATQHLMVSSASATLAGRVLLGVETDTSTL